MVSIRSPLIQNWNFVKHDCNFRKIAIRILELVRTDVCGSKSLSGICVEWTEESCHFCDWLFPYIEALYEKVGLWASSNNLFRWLKPNINSSTWRRTMVVNIRQMHLRKKLLFFRTIKSHIFEKSRNLLLASGLDRAGSGLKQFCLHV